MTVSSTSADTRYAGNGSTVIFATGFPFYANSTLRVSLIVVSTGVETVQNLTTNYTVIGGNGASGSVVMSAAPPAGSNLVIKRIEPYTQATDLVANDPLPAEVLELTYDKLEMQIQQIQYQTRLSIVAEPSFDPNITARYTAPAPVSGKILVGKADGTGWQNTDLIAGPPGPTGPAGPSGSGTGDALVANPLSQFAATTSAQLRGVLSDETGTGAAVFANAPALTSPTVTTQAPGDNTTKAASTAFVTAALTSTGAWSTGDGKLTLKTVADATWILVNDGSIGNGASAATTRANADTEALFTLLWTNCADADCPVSGGRGANAAADFAANKRLTVPLTLGRVLGIAGAGGGLTARALGSTTGAETTTLSSSQQASMTGTVGVATAGAFSEAGAVVTPDGGASYYPVQYAIPAGGSLLSKSVFVGAPNLQAAVTGGGGAHTNMQPTSFWNLMVKL